jgi:hypothetical protein
MIPNKFSITGSRPVSPLNIPSDWDEFNTDGLRKHASRDGVDLNGFDIESAIKQNPDILTAVQELNTSSGKFISIRSTLFGIFACRTSSGANIRHATSANPSLYTEVPSSATGLPHMSSFGGGARLAAGSNA